MKMDLRKFRAPAIITASFLAVCLISYIPTISLLIGIIGNIVVTLVIAFGFTIFFKSHLDRWFAGNGKTNIVDARRKAVFISGCDTGFGHELCKRLHKLGFYVYAGCLFPEKDGANQLRERGRVDGRLRVIPCDVSNMTQVAECASRIGEELRKMQIDFWALVNNAGIASLSEFEWISIETYEKILDINCLGSVRVVKAFLPLLRKSHGRIVIVASLSGRYAIPGFTGYSMSKHAQVALADGLRRELKKFSIQVSLIEPGSYQTNLAEIPRIQKEVETHWNTLPKETQTDYTLDYYQRYSEHLANLAGDANPNIAEPVDSMVDAVTSLTPKLRYVPGTIAVRLRGMLVPLLPLCIQDLLLSKLSIGIAKK